MSIFWMDCLLYNRYTDVVGLRCRKQGSICYLISIYIPSTPADNVVAIVL